MIKFGPTGGVLGEAAKTLLVAEFESSCSCDVACTLKVIPHRGRGRSLVMPPEHVGRKNVDSGRTSVFLESRLSISPSKSGRDP